MQIKYKLISDVKKPQNRQGDNGIDLFIPNQYFKDGHYELKPGELITIGLRIKFELPNNVFLYCCNRSSLGSRGLNILAPLVDSNYRGELHCVIQNISQASILIENGQKIMQAIPIHQDNFSLIETDEINENTNRGSKNFGSTGNK